MKLHIDIPHNTLLETQKWLKDGGVLSAVKAFHFLEVNKALDDLERIEDMLGSVRYSGAMSRKSTN